jgi:putative DNA primase/helicase
VSVDCETGRFFDHENNLGGGVVDLVKHRLGCDHAAAVSWLRSQGFLDGHRIHRPAPRPTAADAPTTEPSKIVAEYAYTDEKGAPLFQVVRYEPKKFRQRKRADNGEWVWRLGDVRRVVYRLPEIIAAVAAGKTVYVVEGEKDADALAKLGLAATTCPGGAQKWRPEYGGFLCGADVVVIGDNDEPGRTLECCKHGIGSTGTPPRVERITTDIAEYGMRSRNDEFPPPAA